MIILLDNILISAFIVSPNSVRHSGIYYIKLFGENKRLFLKAQFNAYKFPGKPITTPLSSSSKRVVATWLPVIFVICII